MNTEKCLRCNGKGKRGLFSQRCAWCQGTGIFQPGPCPKCKGQGKVKATHMSIDDEQPNFSFGASASVVGLDGMTKCTKCDGSGTSINRPHNAIGDK